MSISNKVVVQSLRSLAFGSIGASYVAVGTQFTSPLRMVRIINDCNTDMLFSLDGSTDQFFVPTGSFVLYDFAANGGSNEELRLGGYAQFYVKQVTSPSSGSVYIEGIA